MLKSGEWLRTLKENLRDYTQCEVPVVHFQQALLMGDAQ